MGRKAANAVLWGVVLTLCSFALMNSSAQACRVTSPVTKEMAFDADTVVEGVVVDYKIFTSKSGPVAYIKLKVTKSYRGAPRSKWSFQLWPTTTYSLPGDFADFKRRYGDVIIAGLDTNMSNRFSQMRHDLFWDPAEKNFEIEQSSDFWALPFVVQEPCNKPLLGMKAELEPELRRLGIVE